MAGKPDSLHPNRHSEGMRMTLFSIPKPFTGHIAVIQENTLRSWSALEGVQVVLFGDEEGVADAAARHSAVHIPEIEKTELGTPLVSSAFNTVEEITTTPVLCYANSDVLFFDDLLESVARIPFAEYMLVGRKNDLDVSELIDLQSSHVRLELRRLAEAKAMRMSEWSMEYFVYPPGIDWRFPPFVVGRLGWDAWLVWRARELRLPVIDVSAAVFAVHQNHDYSHIPDKAGPKHAGPETDYNMALLGSREAGGSILEATHELTGGKIRKTRTVPHLRARVLRLEHVNPYLRIPLRLLRAAYRGGKAIMGLQTKGVDESS